jgi:hypothetical protein
MLILLTICLRGDGGVDQGSESGYGRVLLS